MCRIVSIRGQFFFRNLTYSRNFSPKPRLREEASSHLAANVAANPYLSDKGDANTLQRASANTQSTTQA